MKENVLDVLMYLFENYYMDEEEAVQPDQEFLRLELREAGFPNTEIQKAFEWLEALAAHRDVPPPVKQMDRSLRLFNDGECERLDLECRGFLMFLEQVGILDSISRELVIDRIMALGTTYIDIEQLKWVILMVLFNKPGQEAAYAWMEDLVFEHLEGSIH